tara:strand:+ start:1235 stop:1441 length:207 start_codon:yes stop_codon:yes gene_type:complete
MMLCTSFVNNYDATEMPKLHENATLIERLQYYVNFDDPRKAKALAQLGDFLEECYLWDIDFYGPQYEL